MVRKLEGFIAAPLTGYHDNGSVNLEIIPRYAAMLETVGVDAI